MSFTVIIFILFTVAMFATKMDSDKKEILDALKPEQPKDESDKLWNATATRSMKRELAARKAARQ